MTCPHPYTKFQSVTSIGDPMLMNQLENNLKSFLDWCLLGIGAFINVTIPTNSSFGGSFSTLKYATDPSYTDGQVWESIRKDWVWETGVMFSGAGLTLSPIAISGVYVNGVFKTQNDSTYSHYVDYPNGRIVFSGAIPTTSTVQLNYSYRWCQIYKADDAEWFKEGQYATFKPGDTQWAETHNSGDYSIPPQHRVQFPAIVIEAVARNKNIPYELGSNSAFQRQDVMLNIVTENKWARNKLNDILSNEQWHNIWLYDTYQVNLANMSPLDIRGMLVNPTGMYPYLVDNYRLARCYFQDVVPSQVESLNPRLHEAVVRLTCEVL